MALFYECMQKVLLKTCLTPPTLLEMGMLRQLTTPLELQSSASWTPISGS
jgi:hypothetical protein